MLDCIVDRGKEENRVLGARYAGAWERDEVRECVGGACARRKARE